MIPSTGDAIIDAIVGFLLLACIFWGIGWLMGRKASQGQCLRNDRAFPKGGGASPLKRRKQ